MAGLGCVPSIPAQGTLALVLDTNNLEQPNPAKTRDHLSCGELTATHVDAVYGASSSLVNSKAI